MNRRNFFKAVTGFVTGIFTISVEGKKRSGTRYCGETSTSIDPNSEWAKQKPLTLAQLKKCADEIDSCNTSNSINTISTETPKSLGCVDCYRECRHWDKCKAILEKQVFLMAHPACTIDKDGFVHLLI